MAEERESRLSHAKSEFVAAVLESVNQMAREQTEQRVSYLVTGVWNELERAVIRLPAKREKARV